MTREFDFLPDLPKPNLDDRQFQDLVDECKLRIPRYCPEWTNYNPSDPGITMIELFAWLTDQMLVRFNKVPYLNYITFLELLGIRRQGATPAKCEVTFYLSRSLPEPHTIEANTEVATERKENEEAIIFTTDSELIIAQPKIKHILTARSAESKNPQALFNPIFRSWTESIGEWSGSGREISLFDSQPEPGNCFYIVLEDPEDTKEKGKKIPIVGNVIVFNIKAEAATTTGIDPQQPPLKWESWNGKGWDDILLEEADDDTEGFSFSKFKKAGGDPKQTGAEITLHLPLEFPVANFLTYEGRWVRCRHTEPRPDQEKYQSSPRISAISVRSIGGTVRATQSSCITDELLGESNGNPGQTFQLGRTPILPRKPYKENEEYRECIQVKPPKEIVEGEQSLAEFWQEVMDFAESQEEDPHYTIDSITGRVQFGPLIREPRQIKESTLMRQRLQREATISSGDTLQQDFPKRQYGKVPPRGAEIRMLAYRIGGGKEGNVQKKTIRILKSSIPYIDRVENRKPADGGSDAESLEAAIMRVPQMLRTRNRAVTKEDFEILAQEAGSGTIARTHCLADEQPGVVLLLLIPSCNLDLIERQEGISPEEFKITEELTDQVKSYLDKRLLLGTKVRYSQPEYLGVSVKTKVALESEYNNESAKEQIKAKLLAALYRFLNPITGGLNQKGWTFGQPVTNSDIRGLLQPIPGVRNVPMVELFAIRKSGLNWKRESEPLDKIPLGPLELICSWNSEDTLHTVDFVVAR